MGFELNWHKISHLCEMLKVGEGDLNSHFSMAFLLIKLIGHESVSRQALEWDEAGAQVHITLMNNDV